MRRPRFLDYYRQFEAVSPEEDSRRLRARREAERSQAMELAPSLDLSRPEWHEPPDPEIVNAATFALRGPINRYPPSPGEPARRAIARHHGVAPERVTAGHGAAQLIQAAVRRLATGRPVAIQWPTWSALPGLIARTGALPVPVEGPFDPDRIAAADDALAAVVVCSPNDPTGALLSADDVRGLAAALPPDVPILLDEALVDFAGEHASAVPLTDELPALLVFRSFSKAWAMAGLRAGYAVGAAEAAGLLEEIGPGLGVASPAAAGMAAALDPGGRPLARLQRRVAYVAAERRRLERLLADLPVRFEPSGAHVTWLEHEQMDGPSLTHALAGQRVLVAPGAEWGDGRHVRVTLRDRAATERLASALRAL